MKQEIRTIVKKAAKVAGVTCVAAGAVALMTSATAIKALTEGGKYLKDTVEKIIGEEPKTGEIIVEEAAEVVAEESDFAENQET